MGILCAFCSLVCKHKTALKIFKSVHFFYKVSRWLPGRKQTRGNRGSRRQEAVGVEINWIWTDVEGTAKRMWDERSGEVGGLHSSGEQDWHQLRWECLGWIAGQEACAASDNPTGFNTDPGTWLWLQRPHVNPAKARWEYICTVTLELTFAFVSTFRSKQGLQDS